MDRLAIESKVTELEIALQKAAYVSGDMFAEYGINNIADPTDQEKKIYSLQCGRIYNYISIFNDYVTECNALLQQLKETCNL